MTQPTKVELRTCRIGQVNFMERIGNDFAENFTIHSIRIFEDICKAYFTGQLVIEDQLNRTDPYLFPATEVLISWTVETTGGNSSYTERFRIYSIESKPKVGDQFAGMLITINLIGDEHFNDTQNTVIQNFQGITAVDAARQIHNQYIAENGGIQTSPSRGMIGQQYHPHQVLNMKPIKAIHDLLDKAVSITVGSSAFVYFRNKPGYVIAPLEELLTTSPITGRFIQVIGEGADLQQIMAGYNNIIYIRPMAPPSQETATGARSAELDSLMKTSVFFDAKTGNILNRVGSLGMTQALNAVTNRAQLAGLRNAGQALLGQAVKSPFGARMMFNVINEDRQPRTVDKNGPAGYNSAEEAFLAALNFSKKYWVSVPMQSGINVTIGNRINVVYPVAVQNRVRSTGKTLFVARLIHELQFKTPGAKRYEPAQGSTDMYCVEW